MIIKVTDIDTQWAYEAFETLMDAVITAIMTLLAGLWTGASSMVSSLLSTDMGGSFAGAAWAIMCVALIALTTWYLARQRGLA